MHLSRVDGFEHKLTEEKWLHQTAQAEALNVFLIGLKGHDQATHIMLVIMLLITVHISPEGRRSQVDNRKMQVKAESFLVGYACGSLCATLWRFKTQLQF